jgi:hypothetical protein
MRLHMLKFRFFCSSGHTQVASDLLALHFLELGHSAHALEHMDFIREEIRTTHNVWAAQSLTQNTCRAGHRPWPPSLIV